MSNNDWKPVVWDNTGVRRKGVSKNEQLNQALRSGSSTVVTTKKYGSGKNNLGASVQGSVQAQLEEDNENLKHETVTQALKTSLMQQRMKAKLSQKDLAQACNVKVQQIQAYESGQAIPNSQFLGNVERALKQKNPEFIMGTLTKAQKQKTVQKN